MGYIELKKLIKNCGSNTQQRTESLSTLLGDIDIGINWENKRQVQKWWRDHRGEKFEISDDILKLMSKVNLAVKNQDVKKKYKNRFYKYKTKFIKYLLRNDIDFNVYDAGDYWRFEIYGYSFHQLKSVFKNWDLEPIGKEDYTPGQYSELPGFDLHEFQVCVLTMYTKLWRIS